MVITFEEPDLLLHVSIHFLDILLLAKMQVTDKHNSIHFRHEEILFRQLRQTVHLQDKKQTKQTPWPLVRERTIPTDRPPLIDEI
jgi:hypothetical protein